MVIQKRVIIMSMYIKPMYIKIIFACLTLVWPGVLQSNTPEKNADFLIKAFNAAHNKDWDAADHYASKISDPVGHDLITWERLRTGKGTWAEYIDFLKARADWPGLKRLRRKGEAAIPEDGDPGLIRAYFADQLPQTGMGSLRLAAAYETQGHTSKAQDEVVRAWVDIALTKDEEIALYKKYKDILSPHNSARLDNLLWRERLQDAERMLDKVSPAYAKLAKARIGLQRTVSDVDVLIASVPKDLQTDAGLAYDRFQWRIKKGRWDDAQDFLIDQNTSLEKLGRPEAWSNRRRGFARRAMRADDAELAYRLASNHHLTSGSDYADLEWIAGYISLTELDDPRQALIHFQNFQAAVKTPISLGRAGYWLGRTYEKLGDREAEKEAYTQGAKYQTSFYGQLAAEKADIGVDTKLSGSQKTSNSQASVALNSGPVRAGILFHYANQGARMRWFFTHVAETLDTAGLNQLAGLALELDRPDVALAVAKEAAKRGMILPNSYFPITDLATYSKDVAPEIALAIARRESEFNATAISPAGARGLMQIMPATAQQVSSELNIEYSKNRLTSDWQYNAQLGTAYLKGLLERFDGSYILAFASYNAGPHRADAWIEKYGDPRDPDIDPIDWIERIPFRETRNYVMRVMEALHIYRLRLNETPQPIRITQDLARG